MNKNIYNKKFESFYHSLNHFKNSDTNNFNDALTTIISLKNIDAVHYNYSKVINLKEKIFFKDENGLNYFYLFELPEESDAIMNMYTNNKDVSIFINNYGKLIPIKALNIINSWVLNQTKMSIIIKFNNIIPEKITLYYTGIIFNTIPRSYFLKITANYFNNNDVNNKWLVILK